MISIDAIVGKIILNHNQFVDSQVNEALLSTLILMVALE